MIPGRLAGIVGNVRENEETLAWTGIERIPTERGSALARSDTVTVTLPKRALREALFPTQVAVDPHKLPVDYQPPETMGRPRRWVEVPADTWAEIEAVLARVDPDLATEVKTAAEARAHMLRRRKQLRRAGAEETATIDGRVVGIVSVPPSIPGEAVTIR